MDDFIGNVIDRFHHVGQNFVEHTYRTISMEILPVLYFLFVIYIAYYGIQVATGVAKLSIGDIILRILRIMLILVFTRNWIYFNQYIMSWITEIPERLGTVLLSSNTPSATSVSMGLSNLWFSAVEVASAFAHQGGIMFPFPWFISVIIFIVVGVFIGIAFALLISAQLILWAILATAPIFIPCMMFKLTQEISMGWFKQLITYALMPLSIYIIAAFFTINMGPDLRAATLASTSRALIVSDAISFLLQALAGIYVLLNIHQIVQGLVGTTMANMVSEAGQWAKSVATNAPGTAYNLAKSGFSKFNNTQKALRTKSASEP